MIEMSARRASLYAALAGIVLLLLSGCAASPPPLKAPKRIEGRVDGTGPARFAVVDRRARPYAQLGREVDTSEGIGLRLDEETFSQPAIEALAYTIDDELESGVAISGDVELRELDIAVARERSFGNTPPRPAAPVYVPAGLGYAIAGSAIVSMIDYAVRSQPELGSEYLYVRAVLGYRGAEATCEGKGAFTAGREFEGWRAALREVAKSCKAFLIGGSESSRPARMQPIVVNVKDKRVSASAASSRIETSLGVGHRLDDAVLVEHAADILGRTLGDWFGTVLSERPEPVELRALDIAVLSSTSPGTGFFGFGTTASPSMYVKVVLFHRGKTHDCEGMSSLQHLSKAQAFRVALRDAARTCDSELRAP